MIDRFWKKKKKKMPKKELKREQISSKLIY